jgi:hypothetical protein
MFEIMYEHDGNRPGRQPGRLAVAPHRSGCQSRRREPRPDGALQSAHPDEGRAKTRPRKGACRSRTFGPTSPGRMS